MRVSRQSGLPIKIEDIEKFKAEWETTYDKAFNKYSKDFPRLNKLLDRVERILRKKYKATEKWKFVTTKKEMCKIIDENGPIMIARGVNNDLVYLIMDKL